MLVKDFLVNHCVFENHRLVQDNAHKGESHVAGKVVEGTDGQGGDLVRGRKLEDVVDVVTSREVLGDR